MEVWHTQWSLKPPVLVSPTVAAMRVRHPPSPPASAVDYALRPVGTAIARPVKESTLRASCTVVVALLLGVGCGGSVVSSDPGSPTATYNLAVSPEDYPDSQSDWPAGEAITAECWRKLDDWSDRSLVTIRTAAGDRFAFTPQLPPMLLELGGTIRQASSMFPTENRSDSLFRRPNFLGRSRLYSAVEQAAIAACR